MPGKLKAGEEETKAVRRTAKNALTLQADVTRLEKLLSEAGVESNKRSTISEDGARLTAMMYSVAGTLALNGIDVRRWLQEWLTACAKNGRKPPGDLVPWLPWSMSEKRKRALAAPG